MQSLSDLDLSHNHLSGEIPVEWQSSELRTIFLNDNNFTGTAPNMCQYVNGFCEQYDDYMNCMEEFKEYVGPNIM